AGLTLAYQARWQWWPRTANAPEYTVLPLSAAALGRAGLGLAAAGLTLAYQARWQWWPRTANAPEYTVLPLSAAA
ncbi:hypothetical protein, partial [Hymenobacter coccineus]|uniref:hypothetical protein n=1 Tax=Hymenobacter coccineus TaxID=1908235 RepID=UPI00130119D2